MTQTSNISFSDWCAAAWLRMHRRFAFDDASAVEDRIEMWRRAWREGWEPEEYADDYCEDCGMESLDGWNGPYLTAEPQQKTPFPASAFNDNDLP